MREVSLCRLANINHSQYVFVNHLNFLGFGRFFEEEVQNFDLLCDLREERPLRSTEL